MNNHIVTCRVVFMTYKKGLGLDDWIHWHLIHTHRDYRQHSAIAILHTLQFTIAHALGFSVFTSRILATDLLQSPCNFKSHMKSSCHNLITFLPFLLNHLELPFPEPDPILDNNSLKWTLLQLNSQLLTTDCSLGTSRYVDLGRTQRETPSSIV
jgi:hypothetical protein